jgi:8-oxo-dGTP pyrophosphatase MutT (NUDIX family)
MDIDRLSLEQFEQFLARRLREPLPGVMGQRSMAPELAYGRHRGPCERGSRDASVLLLVHPSDHGWIVPTMVRPATMKVHAGQVCLPGGIVEPGETAEETALREFEEELGASAVEMRILGRLTSVCVYVSRSIITPFVAVAHSPMVWIPNPSEVARIVDLPVRCLLDPACRGQHTIERRGLRFEAPHFQVGEHRIWGATAMILAEFATLLGAYGFIP